jgi:hypothetical protein
MDYLYTLFQKPFHKLILTRINCKEIEEVIRIIKLKPASGYNGINIKLIKASAIFISSPLAYMSNKSLSTGIFTKCLKYSEIIPIYIKKETRLICQTIDLYRYFQYFQEFLKVIYKQISLHLNTYNILAEEQYGFKKNSSTAVVAYNLLDNIYVALNNMCSGWNLL